MQVKTENGFKDVNLLDVTPENYICPEDEENFYHCRIEIVKFNSETGRRQSSPRIQKFGRKFFVNGGLHSLKGQGYKVDILHDPVEWEKANAERKAKAEAEAQERKAKAEAEAKAQEREKMKAEILAELKAEEPTAKTEKKK